MFGLLESVLAFLTIYYLPAIGIYIVGGIVYAVLKWTFKLIKLRRRILEMQTKPDHPDYNSYRDNITSKVFGDYQKYPPRAKNNKGTMFFWALFWPINLVWTLIADVATETWAWLYSKFGNLLDKIAKGILPE